MTSSRRGGVSPHAYYLFFAILVLGAGLAVLNQPPGLVTFVFVCTAWVGSVVVHEFGHAYVAHLAGDTSIEGKGYLTLDPFLYSSAATTIVLPLIALAMGGIGFPGGAVYLREDLMRSRVGRAAASLAGPAGTAIVLLGLAVILWVMGRAGWSDRPLYPALAFLAFLQATALVLNLLPVPGLDGYGVVRAFLPPRLRQSLRPVERFGFIALFAALLFLPVAAELLFGVAGQICLAIGISLDAAQAGLAAFRFWR